MEMQWYRCEKCYKHALLEKAAWLQSVVCPYCLKRKPVRPPHMHPVERPEKEQH